jgi:hypothetical protein
MTNNVMFSNLPPLPKPNQGSVTSSLQAFDDFYQFPMQLSPGTLDTIRGFFESRGFDKIAAESISVIIIRQSLQDGINPMSALDGLASLSGAELGELAVQILNYNRFKSSYLGIGTPASPNQQIQRNILA